MEGIYCAVFLCDARIVSGVPLMFEQAEDNRKWLNERIFANSKNNNVLCICSRDDNNSNNYFLMMLMYVMSHTSCNSDN